MAELSYSDNWQLIKKLYKVLNEREKKKEEINREHPIYPYNQVEQQENHLKMKHTSNFELFESVKTPLRTVVDADRLNGKKNIQTFDVVEKIKEIVSETGKTDKIKVKALSLLLEIPLDEKGELEENELLGDGKAKEVINIE